MKKKLVLSALIALSMNQQVFAMSLSEASQSALANDASYAAAVARYEANTKNLAIAKSAKSIQTSINGSATQTFGSQVAGAGGQRLSLDLSKVIYDGQTKYNIKKAEVMQDVYEIDLEIATTNELHKVTTAYLAGLEKQELYDLSQAEVSILQDNSKKAKNEFEAGISNKNQTLDFKAILDASISNLLNAEMEVNAAKIELEGIVGSTVNGLDTNLSLSATIIKQASAINWTEQAKNNNKELQRAKLLLLASEFNVTEKSKMNGPVVTGVASVGTNNGGYGNQQGAGGYVGVEVRIPLGGSKKAYVSQARSEQVAAVADVQSEEQRIATSIQRLTNSLLLDTKIITAKKTAVRSATESLKVNHTAFKMGQLNSMDIILSQKNLSTAKRELISAKYAAARRVIQLLLVSGQLTVANIETAEKMLD